MVGMRTTALTRALIAGLITVGFCIVGDLITFRPQAISERAWGMAWAMFRNDHWYCCGKTARETSRLSAVYGFGPLHQPHLRHPS
jgi:hypothetical protein